MRYSVEVAVKQHEVDAVDSAFNWHAMNLFQGIGIKHSGFQVVRYGAFMFVYQNISLCAVIVSNVYSSTLRNRIAALSFRSMIELDHDVKRVYFPASVC